MSLTDTSPTPVTPPYGDDLPDYSRDSRHYVSDYVSTLTSLLSAIDPDEVAKVVDVLHDAFEDGRRLVVCGNGGSGSTASHLVCDFQKNVFLESGRPFEVIGLSDSPALLSAWANDTAYDNVFAGQARTWLRSGDVLLAISGSGNSPNVLRVIEIAKEVGAISVGWCGYEGGKMAAMVDFPIVVRRRNMQLIEDVHMVMGHIVYSALRDRIRGILKR